MKLPNIDKIYLSSPDMSDENYEMQYIKQAFDSNWIAPLGSNVDGFENEVAKYVGTNYAAALSSGTASIHLALKVLGVTKGDYVFLSAFTFAGTCYPIIYCDAIPVFIDSDYETFNMSPIALEKAFEQMPKPKAVIVVNLYGQSADYDKIRKICNNYNVPIIEDAAESFGATYKGRQTGSFGDIGVFSFNGNKIITTSGGGMLVSDDEKKVKKVKFLATQARDPAPWYQHSEIGYNYRMSNILAGIGRGQLKVLKDRITKKKYIYEFYKNAFSDNQFIRFMPVAKYGEPNYWLTVITLNENSIVNPMNIIDILKKENIEARTVWKPMQLQPVFIKYRFFSLLECSSVCEDIFNRGVCLPSDTKMTDEQLEKVVAIINNLFKRE
jgi:dTDP-4-amino-4,6-dideoxygalactose transaminase